MCQDITFYWISVTAGLKNKHAPLAFTYTLAMFSLSLNFPSLHFICKWNILRLRTARNLVISEHMRLCLHYTTVSWFPNGSARCQSCYCFSDLGGLAPGRRLGNTGGVQPHSALLSIPQPPMLTPSSCHVAPEHTPYPLETFGLRFVIVCIGEPLFSSIEQFSPLNAFLSF